VGKKCASAPGLIRAFIALASVGFNQTEKGLKKWSKLAVTKRVDVLGANLAQGFVGVGDYIFSKVSGE